MYGIKFKRISRIFLPSLIQIDYEHNVVTETSQTMQSRHFNDECKYIINKSIKCLKSDKDEYLKWEYKIKGDLILVPCT